MDNCVFCKIVKGELPSYKIYEDDNFIAFLNIFPVAEGHTLVIPKKHYRWVWDVENIGEYFELCKKIANHYKEVEGVDGIYSLILGEEVPHAHVHLISGKNKQLSSKLFSSIQSLQSSEMLQSEKANEIISKFAFAGNKS